jgi:hypothetical protein
MGKHSDHTADALKLRIAAQYLANGDKASALAIMKTLPPKVRATFISQMGKIK